MASFRLSSIIFHLSSCHSSLFFACKPNLLMIYCIGTCRYSSSVERELPKLNRRVRLPLPAPNQNRNFDTMSIKVTVLFLFVKTLVPRGFADFCSTNKVSSSLEKCHCEKTAPTTQSSSRGCFRLSSADLTAAIDTTTEECQQRCGDNVEQGNDLI